MIELTNAVLKAACPGFTFVDVSDAKYTWKQFNAATERLGTNPLWQNVVWVTRARPVDKLPEGKEVCNIWGFVLAGIEATDALSGVKHGTPTICLWNKTDFWHVNESRSFHLAESLQQIRLWLGADTKDVCYIGGETIVVCGELCPTCMKTSCAECYHKLVRTAIEKQQQVRCPLCRTVLPIVKYQIYSDGGARAIVP